MEPQSDCKIDRMIDWYITGGIRMEMCYWNGLHNDHKRGTGMDLIVSKYNHGYSGRKIGADNSWAQRNVKDLEALWNVREESANKDWACHFVQSSNILHVFFFGARQLDSLEGDVASDSASLPTSP
jgi:hypothetical protein